MIQFIQNQGISRIVVEQPSSSPFQISKSTKDWRVVVEVFENSAPELYELLNVPLVAAKLMSSQADDPIFTWMIREMIGGGT